MLAFSTVRGRPARHSYMAVLRREALRSDGGRSVAFVARRNTVERRAVTTGLEEGGDVEVLAGVSAGERVVVEGPPALADGDRVVAD